MVGQAPSASGAVKAREATAEGGLALTAITPMAARNSTTLARPERLLALKRAFAARKEPGFARKKHGQNGGSGALPEKGYIKIYTFLYITAIALPHQTGQGFLKGSYF